MIRRLAQLGALLASALAASAQTLPVVVQATTNCATSVDGSVVGVLNPLQAPVPAPIYSGNNALWWNKPGNCDTCTWAKDDLWVYLQTGIANYEFDQFIITSTLDSSFGHQCNTTTGYWQYASQTSSWTNSTIPCSLTTGIWHHLVFNDSWNPADTSCGGKPTQYFGTLTIDGVVHNWGTTLCAEAIPIGWTHTVGRQLQMDSSGPGTLTEYIDEATCSYGI